MGPAAALTDDASTVTMALAFCAMSENEKYMRACGNLHSLVSTHKTSQNWMYLRQILNGLFIWFSEVYVVKVRDVKRLVTCNC